MTNQTPKQKAQENIREAMAGKWQSEEMRQGVCAALDRIWPGWREAEAREMATTQAREGGHDSD